jgi:hypothetical protein
MEPECWSPRPQEPATGQYSEPRETSPHIQTRLFNVYFKIVFK